MSASPLDELKGVLADAITEGVTPGAAAAFGRVDDEVHVICGGRRGEPPVEGGVDEHTIYDLASLTKLLSTTLLAAQLVDDGAVALDETPWPSWPGVTTADVLAHRAGLPGWRPLFEAAAARRVLGLPEGARVVVEACLATAPEAAPGTRTLYSDLGFIALGALLEARGGARLDDQLARRLRGITSARLGFVPIFEDGYARPLAQIAPTERCAMRGRVVHGQVHDENAFAMGGVAGHAGLFGSLVGTVEVVRHLARVLVDDEGSPGATLRAFARAPGERPLGFDRATPDGSTGGALSAAAVGHLGFTGTSVWIDPEHPGGAAFFVLLTNRVHPTRANDGIRALRPAFHRAAARALARA